MLNGSECTPRDYTGGLRLQRPNLPLLQYLHRHKCCRIDEVYAPGAGMWGRHGSCRLVDHTRSHPPPDQPSRQPVSDSVDMRVSVADHAEAGNEAVAETVGDIAGTAEDVIGEAFGEISPDPVGVVCRMLNTLSTRLTGVFAPA